MRSCTRPGCGCEWYDDRPCPQCGAPGRERGTNEEGPVGKIVKGVGNTTVDDTPQPTAGTVVDAAPAAPEAEHGAGLASDPAPEARDPHQAEGAGTPVPKTARKADLVEAVVAAGLATEDEAATLTVPDLRALLDTTSTKEPDPE